MLPVSFFYLALGLLTPLAPLPGDGRSWLPSSEAPVLIDLRHGDNFFAGHAAGATNLPVSELRPRLFELPPPGEWPLCLIGSAAELEEARRLLEPKGWTPRLIDESEAGALGSLGAAATGPSDAAAWRPNSFLAAVCRRLGGLPLEAEPGVALDLGCGSGRDAVYLARELSARGAAWQVAGVDNHEDALDRGRDLAARNGVGARCSFVNADLRRRGLEEVVGAAGAPLRLVHGCRFLDVELLCRVPQLLAPQGLFVWSTFQDPSDDSTPLAPPFRSSRRLRRGQLSAMLGGAGGLEVLCDVEGELLTRGKWVPASFFVAQRPAEN